MEADRDPSDREPSNPEASQSSWINFPRNKDVFGSEEAGRSSDRKWTQL